MPAWFYILRLKSNGLYCGSTHNREQRYKDHFAGYGCRTTTIDPPVFVAYEEEFLTYIEAYHREMQIKRWTRAKKETLIKGDMKELKRLAKRKSLDIE